MPVDTMLVKLVRKLRWIGRDDEARELERMIKQVPPAKRDSVLAESTMTD